MYEEINLKELERCQVVAQLFSLCIQQYISALQSYWNLSFIFCRELTEKVCLYGNVTTDNIIPLGRNATTHAVRINDTIARPHHHITSHTCESTTLDVRKRFKSRLLLNLLSCFSNEENTKYERSNFGSKVLATSITPTFSQSLDSSVKTRMR
jgi:hypothetical protein